MHMHGLIVSLFSTDPTLILENISAVIATVPLKGNGLGEKVLIVPVNECEKIRRQSSTAAEEKERLIRYYLNYSEFANWGHLATADNTMMLCQLLGGSSKQNLVSLYVIMLTNE